MSEMMPEMPADPFREDLLRDLRTMFQVYAAAIEVGFPEQRAFELVHGVLLTQLAAVLNSQVQ